MPALAMDPVRMIEQGAPHIIRNDEELASYTEQLFHLTARENPSEAEVETIDLLTLLIEHYERQYRLPDAAPLDVLRFLMEHHGLKQQDLAEELGSIANISLILAGKRSLTLKHALGLASRFHVPVTVFLPTSV